VAERLVISLERSDLEWLLIELRHRLLIDLWGEPVRREPLERVALAVGERLARRRLDP